MSHGRTLNPQAVHDAAAYLFWTLAESAGVAGANQAVIASAGQCLLQQPFTAAILSQYGIEKLPQNDQREFRGAIATEARNFAMRGENMNGVVYADDARSGRSPSAQDVDARPLKVIPYRVTAEGARIEKIGLLCLRHPLPAVVFSDVMPRGPLIEVADTSASLGFHLPMFLANVTTQQLDAKFFVSSGIFYIPVPDNRGGDRWGAAIQNSIRFTGTAKFYTRSEDITLVVNW